MLNSNKLKGSKRSKPIQLKEKTVTASRNFVSDELRDRNRSDIVAFYSGQTPENTLPQEDLKDRQPAIADTAANRTRVLHDQNKRGGGILT